VRSTRKQDSKNSENFNVKTDTHIKLIRL